VRSLPQANGSGDLASTNAIAEAAKELHALPASCSSSAAAESNRSER
jgi:hypothetical protein